MRHRLSLAAASAALVLLAPFAAHAAAPAAAKPAAPKAAAQPADPTASKHIARLVHGPMDHARAALASGYAAAAKADAKLTRAAWVASLGKASDDKSAYLHAAALWTGFGVAADSAKAYAGMMAASDKGYAAAQRDHALQMIAGGSDAAKANAYELMSKAAASDAAALTEQGIMRTEGTGVEG
ncbi:MAG: hypothetical protein K8R56_10305, partial [Candidatus Eisenbacteria bacterium]|nr:hypothetical protein [Candidatus Eisenbacteria bacterium]